jgi:flavin reductase
MIRKGAIAMEETNAGFRRAMRTLTSAVTIISTACEGRKFGMTATAVTSLSMSPPALLACINRSASIHDPLVRRGRFCANILHAHQDELATIFSGKAVDRFAFGEWAEGADEIPYLMHAQANVVCDVDDVHRYGTHTMVVGKVQRVHVRERVNPLLYQNGRYTVGLDEGVDWVIPLAG